MKSTVLDRPAKRQKVETPEEALTYRVAMQVKDIIQLPSGYGYPKCPRCNIFVDREYVAFCDHCGQRLGWRNFSKAKVHKWRAPE